MKNLAMKIFTYALIACGFSSLSFAGIDDRIQDLEQEMKEISARTPQDTLGINFQAARPEVDGTNFFLTFEILYWHMKAGGTEYAYTSQVHPTTNLAIPIKGRAKHNDFGWDWGLKAGLGYHFPHNEWDIYARYTWYEEDDTDQTSQHFPGRVIPDRIIFAQPAEKAKSNFDADYQAVDLELARSYFMSSKLSVRPHLGVKSTWIDLDQIVTYSFPANTSHPGFDFKSKDYNRFWGVGPRLGLDSKWHLGYGFSFFGEVSTALLYGYFKVKRKEFYPAGIFSEEGGNIYNIDNKFHLYVPFLSYYLGLCWEGYVNHKKQHITLNLGYETQYYWRINQMLRNDDTATNFSPPFRLQFDHYSEDISFYGITGRFRLDF